MIKCHTNGKSIVCRWRYRWRSTSDWWHDILEIPHWGGQHRLHWANVGHLVREVQDSVRKRMEKWIQLSARMIHFTKLKWLKHHHSGYPCLMMSKFWSGMVWTLHFCRSVYCFHLSISATIDGWKWSFILAQSFCLQLTNPTPSLQNPRAMGAMFKWLTCLVVTACARWEVTVSLVLFTFPQGKGSCLRGTRGNLYSAPIDFFSPVYRLAHIFGCNWRVSGVKKRTKFAGMALNRRCLQPCDSWAANMSSSGRAIFVLDVSAFLHFRPMDVCWNLLAAWLRLVSRPASFKKRPLSASMQGVWFCPCILPWDIEPWPETHVLWACG